MTCFVCGVSLEGKINVRKRVRRAPLVQHPSDDPGTLVFSRIDRFVNTCGGACFAEAIHVFAERNPGMDGLLGGRKSSVEHNEQSSDDGQKSHDGVLGLEAEVRDGE